LRSERVAEGSSYFDNAQRPVDGENDARDFLGDSRKGGTELGVERVDAAAPGLAGGLVGLGVMVILWARFDDWTYWCGY